MRWQPRGKIRVPLVTMPLADAPAALERQATGKVRGKQVLVIDAPAG